MLSLPLIPPQEDHSGFLRTAYRPRSDSPPPNHGQTAQQSHRDRQRRDEERKQHQARSPLALLAADEAAIDARKAAVRNFGSHWIRPPGVPKTLQAMTEEELERQEQAELERQERGLLDLQAQQQLAETQQQAAEAAAANEAGEEEHDLDEDIPDADATTTDVTFNEDSMMEGSRIEHVDEQDEQDDEQYADMEEAELTGAAQDEEDLGIEMERDLDDSVPEAGSYQHTDTELEDTDSESELRDSFLGPQSAALASTSRSHRRLGSTSSDARLMPSLQDRMRAQVAAADSLPRSPGSLNLSSSILDSSMLASSPVMTRANGARSRTQRGRRNRLS